MLYKHLKWYESIQTTTIPNENINSNKQLRDNKQNEIFDYNTLQFTFIVLSFILFVVFILGCQIRKTRITHFNKQINKQNETKDNNQNKVRYHIIDHIIINVLPSSFQDFGTFTGLFHRKKSQETIIDKDNDKQSQKYEKELEYLKKIV
jgi:hypothetical protein